MKGGRVFIKILWYWLPVVIVAGVIYFLSSQPDLKSGFQPLYDLVLRKLGHMAVFGALAFLITRALIRAHAFNLSEALLAALLIAMVYAVSDEYHQLFTPGRRGEWTDVLIDMAGAGVAAVIASFQWRTSRLKTKRP